MSDEIDNLVFEHLCHIRQRVDSIAEVQAEHGHRLNRIEFAIAGIRRERR